MAEGEKEGRSDYGSGAVMQFAPPAVCAVKVGSFMCMVYGCAVQRGASRCRCRILAESYDKDASNGWRDWYAIGDQLH